MLSEKQAGDVWTDMVSAEIRSAYFAALSYRYQRNQRWLVAGSLVLSSSATLALVTSVIPPSVSWVKPILTLAAAVLSAISLVAKNERNAIDCADLHSRWNALAFDYRNLWSDVYVDEAQDQLCILQKRESEISKSGSSMREDIKLLSSMQSNVEMHHQRELVAG